MKISAQNHAKFFLAGLREVATPVAVAVVGMPPSGWQVTLKILLRYRNAALDRFRAPKHRRRNKSDEHESAEGMLETH